MRAVVQRVRRAEVRLMQDDTVLGRIDQGLLVLLGLGHGDTEREAAWLADKITGLRIFPDDGGNMNRSARDVGGSLLIVSQFTLYGDCRKGRRPSFIDAMPPQEAEPLYERCVALFRQTGLPVATGRFGAMMHVDLINEGPVTIWLDSLTRGQSA